MFVALAPFYIIAATLVLLMLVIAFYRNHALSALLTFAGTGIAFISIFNHCNCLPVWAQEMFIIDHTSNILIGVTLFSALLLIMLGFSYWQNFSDKIEEYYLLFLTSLLGSMVMIASRNFVTFFLGLELLSIPLYALISYRRTQKESVEAGMKYLILAGASTAALVFGLALMYGASGTMDLYTLAIYLVQINQMPSFVLAGLALFFSSMAFKLALVPFHVWTPDVYQGSPAPITAFLSSIGKIGAFTFLLRLVQETQMSPSMFYLFAFLSIASMTLGNILALPQSNVKRILAFSSIAHMGYLIIALLVGGTNGYQAGIFYISIYMFSSIGAFGTIALLSDNQNEPTNIDVFKGLYHRSPFLAITLSASLLSLAGMPLTAGFISKIYLALAGAGAALWSLVILLVINSGIGLYYYLKIVSQIFKSEEVAEKNVPVKISFVSTIAIALVLLIIVVLGIVPGGFMYLIVP